VAGLEGVITAGGGMYVPQEAAQEYTVGAPWRHLHPLIGASRESTAKILQEFQNESLILIHNRYIYITDLNMLQKMAGVQKDTDLGRKWHSTYRYDLTPVW